MVSSSTKTPAGRPSGGIKVGRSNHERTKAVYPAATNALAACVFTAIAPLYTVAYKLSLVSVLAPFVSTTAKSVPRTPSTAIGVLRLKAALLRLAMRPLNARRPPSNREKTMLLRFMRVSINRYSVTRKEVFDCSQMICPSGNARRAALLSPVVTLTPGSSVSSTRASR